MGNPLQMEVSSWENPPKWVICQFLGPSCCIPLRALASAQRMLGSVQLVHDWFIWLVDTIWANMEVSWNGGTPSHHPFLDGIFPYKSTSYCGTLILGNPHMINMIGWYDWFICESDDLRIEMLNSHCPMPSNTDFLRISWTSEEPISARLHQPTELVGFHQWGVPQISGL